MRLKRICPVIVAALALPALGACGDSAESGKADGGEIELSFSQWWEVELPEGVLRGVMDDFEKQNPGVKVKLISNPYAETMKTEIAAAATGTMADVVAINGESVYDLKEQGAIVNLSELMTQANYDPSELMSNDQIDGNTYMVRALNFTYPMYFNTDLLAQAGYTEVPSNWSEFTEAAKAVTDEQANTYAWSMPISVESPAGFDPEAWLWASGGRYLDNRQPAFTTPEVKAEFEFLLQQYKDKLITPGAFTQQEQDKVEEFTQGRNAFMIGSLAHINGIRTSNPDLNFSIGAVPAQDGYEGKRGIAGASWGLGVADNSEHKAEAWKLIEYLLSTEVNSKLATEAIGFPGNRNSTPGYVEGDPLFQQAFDLYQASELAMEFEALPKLTDLRRNLNENLVKMLQEEQTVEETQEALQTYWSEALG
ncbi:MAG: sugar ABC transporter substrate-binding protein [Bifidobacteriaceae bacterium]|jgi:multiple sugar transport system substrate-binding protein|nr:sugar ABC transporter substrate-binding protein [Bifidobacteriaceae bacterium]